MNIAQLIQHPENLNKETLYELRNLLALYPYYQSARLLLLQNLYLLHDSSFNDELKRATIYITERQKLFDLIEANHYQLRAEAPKAEPQTQEPDTATDRTASLIDNFLNQIPADEATDEQQSTPARKPTAADATIDYVAYLLESENEETQETPTPQLKGQSSLTISSTTRMGKSPYRRKPSMSQRTKPKTEPTRATSPRPSLASISSKDDIPRRWKLLSV